MFQLLNMVEVNGAVQNRRRVKCRAQKQEGRSEEESEATLMELLVTINAIASALRNTG